MSSHLIPATPYARGTDIMRRASRDVEQIFPAPKGDRLEEALSIDDIKMLYGRYGHEIIEVLDAVEHVARSSGKVGLTPYVRVQLFSAPCLERLDLIMVPGSVEGAGAMCRGQGR